jgi:hypothetical protein
LAGKSRKFHGTPLLPELAKRNLRSRSREPTVPTRQKMGGAAG